MLLRKNTFFNRLCEDTYVCHSERIEAIRRLSLNEKVATLIMTRALN